MSKRSSSVSTLALARLFSDNCVLQASAPIPVFGTASPGEIVIVTFHNQSVLTTTDLEGKWQVCMSPEEASGIPATLTVTSGAHMLIVSGVLVGEVWICSGQSNMEWPLCSCENGLSEIATAEDPHLRMFTVSRRVALEPLADVAGGEWQIASPEVAGNFSAVGYYFAQALRQARQVPVGIIHTSWGGTRIQAWMREKTLREADIPSQQFPLPPVSLERERRGQRHEVLYCRWLTAGAPDGIFADPGIASIARNWEAFSLDESTWQKVTLPGSWENSDVADLEAIDGGVWFRKNFLLPEDDAGKEAILNLGIIDDFDQTFVNGKAIGATGEETPNHWEHLRTYSIPNNILQAGQNVVAVRVWDHLGDGGILGPIENMSLAVRDGTALSLAGEWLFRLENCRFSEPSPAGDTATVLYNGMLSPLAPYGIRGFVWYQGEANTNEADLYKQLLPALVRDWRSDFQNPDAPFLLVQLAPWKAESPTGTTWAVFREAQNEAARSLLSAGVAVITDLGDMEDIHPRKKQPVGERLARLARRIAYQESVVVSPVVRNWTQVGAVVTIYFTETEIGLQVQEGTGAILTGWEIAGIDGVFVGANARICGERQDHVQVTSPGVPEPVSLRYGWANVPVGNLSNRAGLPVNPFRISLISCGNKR